MLSKKGLTLLADLISQKTIDGNKTAQKDALQIIANYLGSDFTCQTFSSNGYDSAIYLPKNGGQIDVLLSAHIDVVPAVDPLFTVKKREGRFSGRGVFDMKGPLVAMIEALHVFSKKQTNTHIGLLVTSDEEKGGVHGTRYFLENFSYKPKVVIVPDGGNNFDIAIEEKGVLNIELIAEGVNAHTGRPWEGINATHQLIETINQIIQLYPVGKKRDWQTTASVVAFESEYKANNIVPAYAKAKINFRYIKKDSPESILKAVRKISKSLNVTGHVSGTAIAVSPTAKPIRVFRDCVKKETGKLPKCIPYPSTCDARYFSDRSILPIITRPPGGGAHQDDEWISVDGINQFIRILVDFFEQSSRMKY